MLIQASEIKIFKNNDSPGILPFKLGLANIVISKHIFLYDFDLNILKTEITILNQIYLRFNTSLHSEKNPYFQNLIINYEHLHQLISNINQKFINIQFGQKIKRQKRGLINAGGTLQKFLFGTLDANDGEHYENILTELKNNQRKIIQETNVQLSLSRTLIDKYSKTIEKITLNQQKIADYVNNFNQRFDNFSDELYRYISISTMINQIFINANNIITFLNTLENAVTFSKIHVTHPDVLSHENLNRILNELKRYYSVNKILKLTSFSWFAVIHTNCYYSENGILFALEIPIIYQKSYQYFQLLPFPTNKNTIIIPKQPYLALEDETYQYMEQPCIKIEDKYICDQKNLENDPSTDCIASLVQDKKSSCSQVPIEQPKLMFNKINDEYLIIISRETIKIKSHCPEEEYHLVEGNILVQLPENCSISYKTYTFGNKQSSSLGKPLMLLNIENSTLMKVERNSVKPLRIDNIALEDVHDLKRQIEAINPISITEIEDRIPNTWTLWTSIGIILTIIILYGFYKIKMSPKTSGTTTIKKNEESNPPSVLFRPEVIS